MMSVGTVWGQALKGNALVGVASSAGAFGGATYDLRAPFGSVELAQSRLNAKPGVDTAALDSEYGRSLRMRESLLESDSEDATHATVRTDTDFDLPSSGSLNCLLDNCEFPLRGTVMTLSACPC